MPKRALRQRIKDLLDAIPQDVIATRSAAVWRLLYETPEYRAADVIMIYLPLATEVDAQQLAQQAWADLKRVAAARVSWDQRRMFPVEVSSLTGRFEEDSYGVREATEGMPIPINEVDLVVVPGLAYDHKGNRLGRGRGFYDRFLVHPDFRGVSCGVAFEEQVLDDVPVAENDVPIQMLVTDMRVRRFSPAKPGKQ